MKFRLTNSACGHIIDYSLQMNGMNSKALEPRRMASQAINRMYG